MTSDATAARPFLVARRRTPVTGQRKGTVGGVASERQIGQSEDSHHTEVVSDGSLGRDVEQMVVEGVGQVPE